MATLSYLLVPLAAIGPVESTKQDAPKQSTPRIYQIKESNKKIRKKIWKEAKHNSNVDGTHLSMLPTAAKQQKPVVYINHGVQQET